MPFDDSAERPVAKRDGESARPTGAAPVVLFFDGHQSRDGFEARLELELPVRLHDSAIDRKVFAERFLRYSSVGTAGQVAEYLRPQLEASAARVLAEHAAEALMQGEGIIAVAEAVQQAAIKPLFAAGLMADGEPTVRVNCPEWERRRVEEAAEAARVAAAEREGELLRRFEDIRRESADVPAGALLMGLPAGERPDALRALLKAAGQRTRSRLFAVAGDVLCEIDVEGDKVMPLELSSELGPLRSVRGIRRQDRAQLLVGARDGVYLLDPENALGAEAFEADVEASPFGFSNLGYDPTLDVIHATHSDVGLASWQVGLGSRSIRARGEFGGHAPRQIDVHDGQVTVAAGGALFQVEAEGPLRRLRGEYGGGEIAFLSGNPRELLLVLQAGLVHYIARRTLEEQEGSAHLPDAPAIGAALPWLGDVRLVLGTDYASELTMLAAHDTVSFTYRGENGPYKALAAADDLIAAVSSDRQRLVCWRPWEDRPVADLHVISRTRSRLADVTLL